MTIKAIFRWTVVVVFSIVLLMLIIHGLALLHKEDGDLGSGDVSSGTETFLTPSAPGAIDSALCDRLITETMLEELVGAELSSYSAKLIMAATSTSPNRCAYEAWDESQKSVDPRGQPVYANIALCSVGVTSCAVGASGNTQEEGRAQILLSKSAILDVVVGAIPLTKDRLQIFANSVHAELPAGVQ